MPKLFGRGCRSVLVFRQRHEKRNTERVGKPQYQVDVQGVDLAFFREVIAEFGNTLSDCLSLTTKK